MAFTKPLVLFCLLTAVMASWAPGQGEDLKAESTYGLGYYGLGGLGGFGGLGGLGYGFRNYFPGYYRGFGMGAGYGQGYRYGFPRFGFGYYGYPQYGGYYG